MKFSIFSEIKKSQKCRTHNEGRVRNGGSNPAEVLCEIERYYPAASVVEAATSQSRWDVLRKWTSTRRRKP